VPAPPKASNESRQGAQVLVVVDDDDDIRSMLVKALGTTYTIYEARDGDQARQLLEILPAVDGMVCDVMMPRMNGVTLAQLMHKMPKVAHVPILLLTAKGDPIDVIAGINAGARHYVTKPFQLADVIARVKAMTKAR
jgi:DNA-binding response OmpR family regulator